MKGSYHHGALKSALIDRAIGHLDRGVRITELSVRSLAAEIGVSKGAPYRHFPTADALIAAVAARGFTLLTRDMDATDGSLEAIGVAYVRFAHRKRELYRAMYHLPQAEIAVFPDLVQAASGAYERLSAAIARVERRTGALRVSHGKAATAAWSYVHGLAGLIINELSVAVSTDDEDTVTELMSILARGIASC